MTPWQPRVSTGQRLGALVLAAGASTRLGQPKQLLSLWGETLVERAVRIAQQAGAHTVFVVVGAEYQPIFELLTALQPEVRVLLNQRWAEGMATSIALGASAAEREQLDDLLVLTCDQVAVTPAHLIALQHASHREHVAASTYAGRLGVPALFPAFSFPLLQQLTGDRGARDLLTQQDVVTLPLADGDFDIDTPADLQRLREIERNAAVSQ